MLFRYITGMNLTPVLSRDEYIEQAYCFRTLRERLASDLPSQEILEHLQSELLSTTKLPMAIQFLLTELKHSGELSNAVSKLSHYFTSFQHHVFAQAEDAHSRFTFTQALLVLEREAEYRAGDPTPPGLFVYQLESLCRNRLGYAAGLAGMRRDAFYDEGWRDYIGLIRFQLGLRDIAELIFSRSAHYVNLRCRSDPDYQAPFAVLFGAKAGQIAAANRGNDPMFLFATLQRHLGYPIVPRLPRVDPKQDLFEDTVRKVKNLESRISLLEAEIAGELDLDRFLVKKE